MSGIDECCQAAGLMVEPFVMLGKNGKKFTNPSLQYLSGSLKRLGKLKRKNRSGWLRCDYFKYTNEQIVE